VKIFLYTAVAELNLFGTVLPLLHGRGWDYLTITNAIFLVLMSFLLIQLLIEDRKEKREFLKPRKNPN
jgi:hypothetical protein